MQELYKIANCNKPWAAQRAQYAIQLHDALQSGQVSADEYKVLLEDLIRTDKLDAEADDIDIKTILVQSIWLLSRIV
jgi:hypothetical protein